MLSLNTGVIQFELKIDSWISMKICGFLMILSIILIKNLVFSSNEIQHQTRDHRISRSLIRISVYYCCHFRKSNHATSLNRFEDLIQECQTHLGNCLKFSSKNRDQYQIKFVIFFHYRWARTRYRSAQQNNQNISMCWRNIRLGMLYSRCIDIRFIWTIFHFLVQLRRKFEQRRIPVFCYWRDSRWRLSKNHCA